LFDDVVADGTPKPVSILARYDNDQDHFVIETSAGDVRIRQIAFQGELSVVENPIPLTMKAEYVHTAGGEQISQYAAFQPIKVSGTQMAIEFHRVEATGYIHVVARPVGDKKKGE
jgi:hypothetical protein